MAVAAAGRRALAAQAKGGWTLGAHAAHVAAWEALAARRLAAHREGAAPVPVPDLETFNAEIAAAAAARAPNTIVDELVRCHTAFREAVAALDEARLLSRDAWAVGVAAASSYEHYPEHGAAFAPLRPATVAELAARIEGEWRALRGAIRDRGRGGLAAPAGGGWSYRDLVAHFAGWREVVPRRLAEARAGTFAGLAGPLGIDAFNARSIGERRLVGEEALLDELDSAYRVVREALAGLADADLADRRVFSIFAFTTYIHFEEHLAELGAGARP